MEHKKEHDEEEFEEPKWLKPLKWIAGVFLLLIIISWLVPYYWVESQPEPGNVPSLDEVSQFIPENRNGNETENRSHNVKECFQNLDANDPVIKQISSYIASESCVESKLCHAKALYYFVRDNIAYVSDPVGQEYIEQGDELLRSGGGDCESGALLLANMMQSIGIKTHLIVVPRHAFIGIRIDDAPDRYKLDNELIYLDWTCSACGFGEIQRDYVEFVS